MTSRNFRFWLKRFNEILWLKLCNLFSYAANVTSKRIVDINGQLEATLSIPEVKGLPIVGTLFDLIAAGGAPQ